MERDSKYDRQVVRETRNFAVSRVNYPPTLDSVLYKTASMGSFGLEEIKWLAPVRPGDVLSLKRVTLDKRVSKSRPEMGIINFRWEIYNQDGELKSVTVGPNLVQTRSSLEEA